MNMRDCKHGHHAIKCEICELERERDALRLQRDRLALALRKMMKLGDAPSKEIWEEAEAALAELKDAK
jgi:hypothetical protein